MALVGVACGSDDEPAEPWSLQLGTAASDTTFGVDHTPDGDLVVTAATEGSWAGPHQGKRDIVVARLAPDGTERWAVQLGGEGSDSPLGISTAPDGSIYVAGFTDGDFAAPNAGSADVFVLRLDAEGNELWRQQFGGDQWDRGFDVTAFDTGAYVSGYSASELDPETDDEGFDGFVARYDADGTQAWVRQVGTPAADWGQGSSLAPDNGVYLTGYTEGDLAGPNAGGKDGFLARIDAGGNLVWTAQFGSPALDWPQGVGTTPDGGALLAGSTEGDLSAPNAGGRDAFIAAFGPDGTAGPITQFGTSEVDSVFEVRALGDGAVATGSSEGDLAGSNGQRDGLLVWLDDEGELTIDQIGSAEVDDLTGLSVAADDSVSYSGGTFGALAGTHAGDSDIVVATVSGPTDD